MHSSARWQIPSICLPQTKAFAQAHEVDLAIPNCRGSGIGNALVYTRLVEDWSRHVGRPLHIATGPLRPAVGCVGEEDPFALWRHNPFVRSILDAEKADALGFEEVNAERRTLVQINHVIENICFAYGIRPRALRPSLFLSSDEMSWAMDALAPLGRPLVCLHPGGTTRSLAESPWHLNNWRKLVETLKGEAYCFQIGRPEFGDPDLSLPNPGNTLRQAMALIWAADVFVGFDSSPMSIATAFAKPTVALFDMERKYANEGKFSSVHVPSVMLRWSYPQNRNIAIMDIDEGIVSLAAVIDAVRAEIARLTYRI